VSALASAPMFKTPANVRMIGLALLVIGGAMFAYGLTTEAWRAWAGALIGSYYFTSLAIGCGVIIALMNVTKAGWGIVVRRVAEAITGYMPFALLTMLAVTYLGMHSLYEWSHEDIVKADRLLQHKAAYLNVGGFLARMVVIIGGWWLLTGILRKNSLAQDNQTSEQPTHRNLTWSVLFLIFFGLSITFGSLDWLMSLEPHWFSTMFGVYHFAGAHVAGCALVTVVVIQLKKAGYLPSVNENHLHDMGKMMFAFSIFWAYIWISQYLLIWYSNIPEETGYYLLRYKEGWFPLFGLNVVINFVLPFFILMPRPNKRDPKVLMPAALILLFGHWLDIYLQVVPPVAHFAAEEAHRELAGPVFGIPEIGGTLAIAGLFLLVVTMMLGKVPLLPKRDPYLDESLHHHQ
jgi:hypothetical protein